MCGIGERGQTPKHVTALENKVGTPRQLRCVKKTFRGSYTYIHYVHIYIFTYNMYMQYLSYVGIMGYNGRSWTYNNNVISCCFRVGLKQKNDCKIIFLSRILDISSKQKRGIHQNGFAKNFVLDLTYGN